MANDASSADVFGYELDMRMSAGMNWAMIRRVPDDARCSLSEAELPLLIADLAKSCSHHTLHAWFEQKGINR